MEDKAYSLYRVEGQVDENDRINETGQEKLADIYGMQNAMNFMRDEMARMGFKPGFLRESFSAKKSEGKLRQKICYRQPNNGDHRVIGCKLVEKN